MSTRVAVAAPGRQSLEAGLAIAAAGGSAVDAALAASAVALATEPGIVNVLGGAFVTVWPAGGAPVTIDGYVEMPGRGLPPERFGTGLRRIDTAYGGGVTLHGGPGSVATPGTIPAFALASDRYGILPWARLLEPAIDACRDGYPLSLASATYLAFVRDTLFAEDAEARAVISRGDGQALVAGELTTNPALAETLTRLGAEGPELFVSGDVARAFAADQAATGGLVTAADLAAYRPIVRDATQIRVGGWTVATNPPPSVGGPMLAVMLRELTTRVERDGGWSWAEAIDVQRRVLTHRLGVHNRSSDLEGAGLALLAAVERYGLAGLPTSPSTAHVSVVDAAGNACAVTMSAGYHSGTCVPGTGLLCNNALGEVELNPLGLHALPPGTRLASNMAPTVAHGPQGEVLAIGSPGADRITSALMLVLGGTFLRGLDLAAAVAEPRLHVRIRPAEGPDDTGDADDTGAVTVEHEPSAAIAHGAAALGLAAEEYPGPHMYFGGVGGALLDPDGVLLAAGDDRREAAVGVSGPEEQRPAS